MNPQQKTRPPAIRFETDHALVRVHVTPGARRDEVVATTDAGEDAVVFRVKTRAPAEGGKANKAVAQLVAESLGLAKSRIAVKSGGKSRLKVLRIDGAQCELAPLFSRSDVRHSHL